MQTYMVCDIKFTEPPSFRSDAALLLNLNLNYEKLRLSYYNIRAKNPHRAIFFAILHTLAAKFSLRQHQIVQRP